MNPFPKPPQSPSSQQQQLMQLLQQNPQLMQKYQQEIAKMQAQQKSVHPPMTSQQYMEKLQNIEKYLDNEGGITIQPKAAFVLKFMDKRTNQKIFVNVVTHPVIDHPQQKTLVDFENQPGLRIPMSMGRVRQDTDKNGSVCKVVDVVLNPMIVQNAQNNVQILGFTGQIIGNYLLEKYKIAIAQDVLKKVKGVKYKGNCGKVQIQRVKGKKAPKIQQISEEQAKAKQVQQQKQEQMLNQINEQKKTVLKPQFQVFAYNSEQLYEAFSIDVKQYKHLKILISLPHLIHSKGIHFEASDRFVYLSVQNLYQLCLKMPFQIRNVSAKFSRKQRKLELKVYKLQQSAQIETKQIKSKQTPKIQIKSDLLSQLV